MSQQSETGRPESGFSHRRTIERFSQEQVAEKYPSAFGSSLRGRLEERSILRALKNLSSGDSILDLPCGTGRLTPLLLRRGLRITGADCSPPMVQQARENWLALRSKYPDSNARVAFEVRDVMETGFADGQFDAVICHRLFHHFNESETRVRALTELGRICSGPLIVSFFNSFAIDAVRFRLRHRLRGTIPRDRIPIPMPVFLDDVARAGLEIQQTVPVLWGVSPLWIVVAQCPPGAPHSGDIQPAGHDPNVRAA